MEQNGAPRTTDKTKEVRRSNRADWRKYAEGMVTNDPDIRDMWLGVQFLKKERKPNLYQFADKDGNVVSIKKEAEATADYLETVQWKKHENLLDRSRSFMVRTPFISWY